MFVTTFSGFRRLRELSRAIAIRLVVLVAVFGVGLSRRVDGQELWCGWK